MRGLKIAVVVMGIMLVVGFAALIVAVAYRMSHPRTPEPTHPQQPVAGQAFVAAPVELPPGGRIEAMATSADRLVLDILLPDGNRQLLILDPTTGRRIGTIPLHATPRD